LSVNAKARNEFIVSTAGRNIVADRPHATARRRTVRGSRQRPFRIADLLSRIETALPRSIGLERATRIN
jgi:hypothetical protein